jgi:2-C-methyl-D-erythritol 2,4-cyclodiphosphate synthase
MSEEASPSQSRVGWGFDAHALDGDPPLVLGGVVVSDTEGVRATSDGDLVAHALTDAVLGAAALADIGEHFPSDHPSSRGADSLRLLSDAVGMAARSGWLVTHADVTVVAESIRIWPHRDSMRARLAETLGVGKEVVSVKATTTDGLGFIGRGEGMAAVAVVTMAPRP